MTPAAPRLAAVATALPPHRVSQADARAFVARAFAGTLKGDGSRLLQVFDHSGIETRHACMPLEWYETPHDFGETNARYVEHALELTRAAAVAVLARAGLESRDVTHFVFVSSTGLATPSIDARLVASDGFREGVRRIPVWGLGCAGGSAGLAMASELAGTRDDAVVLVVALELCSLAFQRRDLDARNIVASALFADGAAAAIVTSATHAARATAPASDVALEIVGAGSRLWRDTLDIMGWNVDATGLHVVFSRDIPAFVHAEVRPDLEAFLARHGMTLAELDHFVAHPGGPKVLDAYSQALGVEPERFHHARDVLRCCGNMSSPTCLFVLERTLAANDVRPGQTALVAALGPGFASEYVLLRGAPVA